MNKPTKNSHRFPGMFFKKACLLRFLFGTGVLISGFSGSADFKEIYQIQGKGDCSPFKGRTVFLKDNIVTAISKNGFFIQTPPQRSDNNPETSDGIFVYTKEKPKLKAGDIVDVKGRVKEFYNLTEISIHGKPVIKGRIKSLPEFTAIDLLATEKNNLEKFEGMLVSIQNLLVTAPSDRFGEAWISYTRKKTPKSSYSDVRIKIDPDGIGSKNLIFFSGTEIGSVKGVLSYSYGSYKILPVQISGIKKRAFSPVRKKRINEFTAASFNLYRMFDTEDAPDKKDPVYSGKKYQTFLRKRAGYIVKTLLCPDIIAVQEVENISTLEDLSKCIKVISPKNSYKPFLINGNDPSGMNIGFLAGSSVKVDSVVQYYKNSVFTWKSKKQILFDRPPVAVFCHPESRKKLNLAVICVHLRSRIGINSKDSLRIKLKRSKQLAYLLKLINNFQDNYRNINLIVTGDFNTVIHSSYFPEQGRNYIREHNHLLFNANSLIQNEKRYSFIYRGESTCFDYMFISKNIADCVSKVQFGRGNCDSPELLKNNPATNLRASDHDAVVMYLDLKCIGEGR